jgi:hypothetical protein
VTTPLPPPERLASNRRDAEAARPPHFGTFPPRPEQRRSLSWMLALESTAAPFVEEALLPAARLTARGARAAPPRSRAAAVYGKTATAFALVESMPPPPRVVALWEALGIDACERELRVVHAEVRLVEANARCAARSSASVCAARGQRRGALRPRAHNVALARGSARVCASVPQRPRALRECSPR